MREARRKFQIEGGDQCHRGGGLNILGMGGTGPHGGGTGPHGVGSPPIPPHTGQPCPGTVLKYSELVTLLAKISHSINSRPLGLGSTSQDSNQEDYLSPITPNQLLLGKTGDEAPPLDYDETDSYTARLAYVSAVYGAWWDAWYKQVLPSLIPSESGEVK